MELDRILKERRTIRKYSSKDVSWMLVSEVLNAGRIAPSSGNLQNWNFIVVRSKEAREKVMKFCDDNSWASKAPVLIVICADNEKMKRMFGSRGVELYSIQNCACAAMQMMLKAYDLGLGSAWIGSFDENGIVKALEIDKTSRPQMIIALGHGESSEELKRSDLSTMVFFDKFGDKERKGDYAMLPLQVPFKRSVEPMKEKLKNAFNDVSDTHKDKVKHFISRFSKKKE